MNNEGEGCSSRAVSDVKMNAQKRRRKRKNNIIRKTRKTQRRFDCIRAAFKKKASIIMKKNNIPDPDVSKDDESKDEECVVCHQIYDDKSSEDKKVSLKCGHHHLCYTCYLVVYKSNNPCCPICRFPFFDEQVMSNRRRAANWNPDPRLFDASIFEGEIEIPFDDPRWRNDTVEERQRSSSPISSTSSDDSEIGQTRPSNLLVPAHDMVQISSDLYVSIAGNRDLLQRRGLLPNSPSPAGESSSQQGTASETISARQRRNSNTEYDQSQEFAEYQRRQRASSSNSRSLHQRGQTAPRSQPRYGSNVVRRVTNSNIYQGDEESLNSRQTRDIHARNVRMRRFGGNYIPESERDYVVMTPSSPEVIDLCSE